MFKELITHELKTKFSFKGLIMSDWYAIYSNDNQHFTNGLDMNQQGGTGEWEQIPSCVKQGYVSEDRVNDVVKRILDSIYKVKQIKSKLKYKDLH